MSPVVIKLPLYAVIFDILVLGKFEGHSRRLSVTLCEVIGYSTQLKFI